MSYHNDLFFSVQLQIHFKIRQYLYWLQNASRSVVYLSCLGLKGQGCSALPSRSFAQTNMME